jgi:hypothetical protein
LMRMFQVPAASSIRVMRERMLPVSHRDAGVTVGVPSRPGRWLARVNSDYVFGVGR